MEWWTKGMQIRRLGFSSSNGIAYIMNQKKAPIALDENGIHK
jgi:hypothetical protein